MRPQTKKLIDLLDKEDLGDRKPSVFYRKLRELAPIEIASDELIKKRWLSKLPSQTQTIANAFNELTGDLEQLLNITDRMHISRVVIIICHNHAHETIGAHRHDDQTMETTTC